MQTFGLLCCYLVLVVNNVVSSQATPRVNRVAKDNITIVAVLQNIPIQLVSEVCSHAGGKIVSRLFFNTAVKFFKTLDAEYKTFWLGASFINGTWWWNDGTHLHLKKFQQTDPQNDNNTCLIYNRELDKVERSSCSSVSSTVCAEGSGTNIGKLLLVLIQKYIARMPQTNLLFAVDNDRSIAMKYASSIRFIRNFVNTIILKENRSFGFEWYSSNAWMVNYGKNSSNCVVRTEFEEWFLPKVSTTTTLPNYYKAIRTAEIEMAKIVTKNSIKFLFFFALRPDSGPLEQRNKLIARLKDLGAIIIVIAFGHEVITSTLEGIPSTINDQLQLYVFDNARSFIEATQFLRRKRRFAWNDCTRRHVPPL